MGEQQRVEILKVLARDARVLILDEPTAVLTPQEADVLFDGAASGWPPRAGPSSSSPTSSTRSWPVSDRVTVLRDGRNVGTVTTADTDSRELARLMVGSRGRAPLGRRRVDRRAAPTRLRRCGRPRCGSRACGATDDRGAAPSHGVDLTVAAGEIVGVCGVSGNGQRELAEVVAGMRRADTGTVEVAGIALRRADARAARRAGVAHVPEDRLHTGTAPSLSVEDNLALTAYRRPPDVVGPVPAPTARPGAGGRAHGPLRREGPRADRPRAAPVGRQRAEGAAGPGALRRSPRCSSPRRPPGASTSAPSSRCASCSSARPPTASGVLLISEDLDEILDLSDRIAVMYEGRIVGVVDRADADVTELGLLMGGGSRPTEAAS